MIQKIRPTKFFSGTVRVPSDKSLTHRSIIFSALAKGVSTIKNPLLAEDCFSTARCVEDLGCRIEKKKGLWKVHGVGLWGFKAPAKPLNCGNSGTTMRLLSGVLAAQDFSTVLEGDASLSKRPMSRVADPLREMGAALDMRDDQYAPFVITGKLDLKPIHWKNPVASAQVKSAVLLAGLHAKGETVFEEPSLSRDHTERMLKACGVNIKRSGTKVSVVGPAKLKPQKWVVPGDISSAAFFLVGGLLIKGAKVTLRAVNTNPTRTGILDVLVNAGAEIEFKNKKNIGGEPVSDIVVQKQTMLKPFTIDFEISPRLIDEIPILAVAATQCGGTSIFSGLEELRFKETDRLKAIAQNLKAMGADIEERNDGLVIHGPTLLHGAEIDSFDDHRIAMAFAMAGLIADGSTSIRASECVSISFPSFWKTLQDLCKK